uniref:Protein SMG5 n=1 Tax=Timema douglasi TaxID=61478 RepID=A0A7R8VGW4_TIMDO|nr:unnamed protein product [Timema douglasi]
MKKSFNPVSDVRGESVEVSRRLYRVISDAIRHLDDSRGRAETCNDLFTLPLEAQRERLREYCERLIFADPIGYGRKGEELLWRKVYYDVVTTAKHLRKDQSWGDTEVAHLKSHLFAGVGHYHHLIDRLQIEYQLDLKGLVDFPLPLKGKRSSSKRSPDKTCVEWSKQAVHRCLVYLGDLSRYILDLHPHWDYGLAVRYYLQALNMNWEVGMPHNQLGTLAGLRNYGLDASYHYMRCLLCPQSFEGAEGNLVRLFEKNSCWLEGEGGNSRNMGLPSPTSSENIHRLISRFLLLQDVWFFDKTAVPDLPQLCHQTLQDLQHCLSYLKPFTEPKEYQLESEEHPSVPDCPDYLCDNTVLRMVVMVLMCVTKLQNADSQQLSSAVAFLAAMFSQLVDQVIQHFQDSVLSLSLPPAPLPLSTTTSLTSDVSNTGQGITQEKDDKKNKKRKKKLRRRRRRRLNSSEDSDLSEGEGPFGESSSSEDAEDFNSDISEKGEREGDTSSGDDAEDDSEDESSLNSAANDKGLIGGEMKEKICNGKCKEKDQLICEAVTNGFSVESNSSGSPLSVVNEGCDVIPKTEEPLVNGTNNPAPNRLLDPADVVELLGEEGLLAAVKVCADWMRGDSEVVKACGRSSRLLLSHVVTLLNLINVDIEALEKETDAPHFVRMKMLNTSMQSIPLPEDIGLKGISPLKTSHNGLDWDYFRDNSFKVKEEGLLRAFKLVEFGHYLASIPDTGMRYDSSTRQFVISEEPPTLSPEVPEIEEKGKRTSKPANELQEEGMKSL